MMVIYNITEVEFCKSLCKYYDVTLAENAAAAYKQCFRLHIKLILTAILLKFSQTTLKVMYI